MTPSLTLLTRLRAQVTARLPGTATIQENTPANNGLGGRTDSWASAGTSACKLFRNSGREYVEGDRQVARGDWLIRLPWGTAVTTLNQLVVDGHTYQVLATDADRTDALALNCECKRLD